MLGNNSFTISFGIHGARSMGSKNSWRITLMLRTWLRSVWKNSGEKINHFILTKFTEKPSYWMRIKIQCHLHRKALELVCFKGKTHIKVSELFLLVFSIPLITSWRFLSVFFSALISDFGMDASSDGNSVSTSMSESFSNMSRCDSGKISVTLELGDSKLPRDFVEILDVEELPTDWFNVFNVCSSTWTSLQMQAKKMCYIDKVYVK